ncbi:hypothetical protein ACFQHO_40160 [Actinomadura yumaensis]
MTEQTNDRARRPRLAEVYEPGRPGCRAAAAACRAPPCATRSARG